MNIPETLNIRFLEEQYRQYSQDPGSVSREWQVFFHGFDIGLQRGDAAPEPVAAARVSDAQVAELIHRYRDLGHLLACMDPLSACPTHHPLLDLASFGLGNADLDKTFAAPQLPFLGQARLKEIIDILRQTYCRSIGVEYMHLQDPAERQWLQERMEPVRNAPEFAPDDQRRILAKLTRAAMFEQFFNKKYVAVTRFSLEGGDSLIPMLDAIFRRVFELGAREIVLGMAHRGRLNVQANILNRPVAEILAEFEHCYDSSQLMGAGDVKYHKGYLADIAMGDEKETLRAFLVNNPSHLEAVDPVIEGFVRARQDILADQRRGRVVPLLLHGDAAFAGQGIVAETLNMSRLAGYATGGTLHIVINNQIGYTTLPQDARSTRYSTDIAKMLMVPIFHVHGENPEALVHVARLAADYRYAFGKDVVIDLVCYRRFGHNEGDEPYFTQPLMYDRIHERPSVHRIYAERLIEAGRLNEKDLSGMEEAVTRDLESVYDEVRGSSCPYPQDGFYENWQGYHGRYAHQPVATGVSGDTLISLARKINTLPEDFSPHPKVKLLLKRRLEAVEKGEGIDWANAESLAFASLLHEGLPIRLSGQDSARGTFSQRHSVLFDRRNGAPYTPLAHLDGRAGAFRVYNSLLAEAGVVGFEYGYAAAQPLGLTLWEAQFGDFSNNAQIIIDLFIAAGESKWQRLCGLGLLLPHGWEGLGPEHSSARLERFLQLCADDNMQVCDLTTPAQYFHLLRRQAKADYRKPLVLMTPKSLLRHPRAVSTLDDLAQGVFQPVLDDPSRPSGVRKVLVCSGKIYYQLLQRREELNESSIAIVRLEQFHPFPEEQIHAVAQRYSGAESWTWVQEAPQNMGAWQFVRPLIEAAVGQPLAYVGRKPGASPATGFPNLYKLEQEAISSQALGPVTNGKNISG